MSNLPREERAIKPESILDHYNTESTPIIKDPEQAQVTNTECKCDNEKTGIWLKSKCSFLVTKQIQAINYVSISIWYVNNIRLDLFIIKGAGECPRPGDGKNRVLCCFR